MSNYNKYLVDIIQKYAKKPPANPTGEKLGPPPATTTPAPTAALTGGTRATVPKPGQAAKPTGGAGVSSLGQHPAIKKMQESIIALANAVNNQIKLEDMAQQSTTETVGKDQFGKDVGAPTQEASEAASRGHFSNFIAKMLRDSEPEGVEYDPSASKTEMSQKKPSEATRMYTIMNTISRLGGAAKEMEPDGKWGPRTNTGLRDTAAFASAMLRLAGAFKTPIKSYTDGDLKAFVVPEKSEELSYAQKVEQAPILTKHIEAIHRMFLEVKKKILENPRNQSYIEGNQEYTSYKKVVPLTQTELSLQRAWARERLPENYFNISMDQPGVQGAKLNSKINYTDLVSPQSFDAWFNGPEGKEMQQPGVTKPMVLAEIRSALQAQKGGA